ncbi:MAG: type I DNA topoisomerase [Chloroflexi bacterium]|nr:type I DNA topoisomerase [Chloroflexota bacterium]
MQLLIVESPKKAKTIASFLGSGFRVEASFGHVRDLPLKELGIDTGHDFEPHYVPVPKARERLSRLRSLAKEADGVLLATDPDREGEAIAWHLVESLRLPRSRYRRVVFHELSRRAVEAALRSPRTLDAALVDAQQARRILDRLVGYQVSPLLWHKVQRGTSAGRVQSAALGLVVDREREIRGFVPREYWTIDAELAPERSPRETFWARLVRVDGTPTEVPDESTAQSLVAELERSVLRVAETGTRERDQSPPPPFITSTLQQSAASRLKWTGKKTMQIAQSLFEGGWITYHRTDSVNVSAEAVAAAREIIAGRFGPEFLPNSPRRFSGRVKNAQEAHEAIRPVAVERTPETATLSGDEHRLYTLVWQRFVASQMAAARYRTDFAVVHGTSPTRGMPTDDGGRKPQAPGPPPRRAKPPAPRFELRAEATTLIFPGYLALYGVRAGAGPATDPGAADSEAEGGATPESDAGTTAATAIASEPATARRHADGPDADELPKNDHLPTLVLGEPLLARSFQPKQHFTRPPARYTEPTLIRALERLGIGRPSTYATIVATLDDRGYVVRERGHLVPTPLGFAATDFLLAHFPNVVDTGFTADLEERLDAIARGEAQRVAVLRAFYDPFRVALETARSAAPVAVPDSPPPAAGSGRPRAAARGGARSRPRPSAKRPATSKRPGMSRPKSATGPSDATTAPKPRASDARSGSRAASTRPSESGSNASGGRQPARHSTSAAPKSARSRGGTGSSPRRNAGSTTSVGELGSQARPDDSQWPHEGVPASAKPRRGKTTETAPPAHPSGAKAGERDARPDSASPPACPRCGAPLARRTSRYGPFLGCTAFPRCDYVHRESAASAPAPNRTPDVTARPKATLRSGARTQSRPTPPRPGPAPTPEGASVCPVCGRALVVRVNRRDSSHFQGCSGYPSCRFTKPEPPPS